MISEPACFLIFIQQKGKLNIKCHFFKLRQILFLFLTIKEI